MDTTEATFDVVILGFDARDEPPEVRLQRAFDIGPEPAAQIIARLPATVQRAVSRVRADYFSRALVLAGARVEVRDEFGSVVAHVASTEANTPAAGAAPAPAPTPQMSAAIGPVVIAPLQPARHSAGATITAGPATVIQPMDTSAMSDTAFGVRAPAHPTWQEAPAAARARATSDAAPGVASQPAPAADAVNALWRDPSSVWDAPKPAPAALPLLLRGDPSSVWDAPAAAAAPDQAAPAVSSPGDPSSVWDPPASKPRAAEARAVEPAARRAAQPAQAMRAAQPVQRVPSAQPPPASRPPAASQRAAGSQRPAASQRAAAVHGLEGLQPNSLAALDAFDITKSVVSNALWRPPAAVAAPVSVAPNAPAAALRALTLDTDVAAAPMRVLEPWEQAGAASMAEPTPNGRALQAAARALPARARPAPPAAGARPQPQPVPQGSSAPPPVATRAAPARAPRPMPAGADAATPQATENKPTVAVGLVDRGQRMVARADVRSFWQAIPDALKLPFSGPGTAWLGAIGVVALLVGGLDHVSAGMPLSLGLLALLAHTALLAFACDYYRVCFWAPVASDQAIDRAPEFDPARLVRTYVKSGLHLTCFMLLSQGPGIVRMVRAFDGIESVPRIALDPVNWLLLLLPYLYWPMGVALTAIGNDFAAIWNVPTGVRAMLRAPLEYAVVGLIGGSVFIVSWLALLIPLGAVFGSSALVSVGSLGLPLALCHGVQGALMGHLVRARGDVFD